MLDRFGKKHSISSMWKTSATFMTYSMLDDDQDKKLACACSAHDHTNNHYAHYLLETSIYFSLIHLDNFRLIVEHHELECKLSLSLPDELGKG